MNSRAILFNALGQGEILGNEEEISRALILSEKDDLELYRKTPYFHAVIASVWRNKDVIRSLRLFAGLSFYDYLQILKKVELTDAEYLQIHNTVMSRVDLPEDSAFVEALSSNKKAVVTITEELWKTVFSEN